MNKNKLEKSIDKYYNIQGLKPITDILKTFNNPNNCIVDDYPTINKDLKSK